MKRTISLLTAAIILCHGLPAASQSSQDLERFESHVAQGSEAFEEERFEEARVHFLDAYEIHSHPALAIRIATAEARSGRCDRSRQRRDELDASQLSDDAREALERLERDLSECVSTGRLLLDCDPVDAKVRMADERLHCGRATDVATGTHRIDVDHPDYLEYSTTVRVEEGEEVEKRITLSPLPDSDRGWMTPLALSTSAAGLTMVLTGIVVDSRAPSRQEEILEASAAGDPGRVDELESRAARRRKQTKILVGAGAGATLAGGIVFSLRRIGSDDPDSSARLLPSSSGITFHATW